MVKSPETKQSKQIINDLIFRELIKRGYSLEGNTRVWNIADSKLWYLTPEQAQGYLDLERDKGYQKNVIGNEIDLIKTNIDSITSFIDSGSVNIIDLGCGDGKKAVIFLTKLKEKLKEKNIQDTKIRYCPIDISNYMVEKALTKVREADIEEIVTFQWNISDFENIENVASLLRHGNYKRNLFLLLGNTLGNFEINELLYEIRSAMKDGDILVVGNGLDNRSSEAILKTYNNKQIDNWLIKILTQIGIKREDVKYGARFKNLRIEEYYVFLKDVQIDFLGKKLLFNKDDQIITAVSYKYEADEFKSFLKMYFSESNIFISKDKSYALAVCKK